MENTRSVMVTKKDLLNGLKFVSSENKIKKRNNPQAKRVVLVEIPNTGHVLKLTTTTDIETFYQKLVPIIENKEAGRNINTSTKAVVSLSDLTTIAKEFPQDTIKITIEDKGKVYIESTNAQLKIQIENPGMNAEDYPRIPEKGLDYCSVQFDSRHFMEVVKIAGKIKFTGCTKGVYPKWYIHRKSNSEELELVVTNGFEVFISSLKTQYDQTLTTPSPWVRLPVEILQKLASTQKTNPNVSDVIELSIATHEKRWNNTWHLRGAYWELCGYMESDPSGLQLELLDRKVLYEATIALSDITKALNIARILAVPTKNKTRMGELTGYSTEPKITIEPKEQKDGNITEPIKLPTFNEQHGTKSEGKSITTEFFDMEKLWTITKAIESSPLATKRYGETYMHMLIREGHLIEFNASIGDDYYTRIRYVLAGMVP